MPLMLQDNVYNYRLMMLPDGPPSSPIHPGSFRKERLLQTLWFAVQTIVRLIQKLPLTAIEVTTLAFVALNVLTYFF
jgi:hypothetical protein